MKKPTLKPFYFHLTIHLLFFATGLSLLLFPEYRPSHLFNLPEWHAKASLGLAILSASIGVLASLTLRKSIVNPWKTPQAQASGLLTLFMAICTLSIALA